MKFLENLLQSKLMQIKLKIYTSLKKLTLIKNKTWQKMLQLIIIEKKISVKANKNYLNYLVTQCKKKHKIN